MRSQKLLKRISVGYHSRLSGILMKRDSGQAGVTNKTNRPMRFGVILITVLFLFTIHCSLITATFAAEKWPGVDESVVEKHAKEHGREAREPFINTDQGDLLLFVFLLAGTIGGFAAGYFWKELTGKNCKNQEATKQQRGS